MSEPIHEDVFVPDANTEKALADALAALEKYNTSPPSPNTNGTPIPDAPRDHPPVAPLPAPRVEPAWSGPETASEIMTRLSVPATLAHDDYMGAAREFIERECRGSRLKHWRGAFYMWTKAAGHYKKVSEDRLESGIRLFLDKAFVLGKNNAMLNYFPHNGHVNNVLKSLMAITSIPDSINAPCWIDSVSGIDPKKLLPLKNGLLFIDDSRRRILLPHTADFFCLGIADVAYDAKADKPKKWVEFLNQIFPKDPDSVRSLRQIIGYCTTSDTSFQKMFVFQGRKRAGKGTVLRVIEAMLGTAHTSATFAQLASEKNCAHIIGKGVCVVPDAAIGKSVDTAIAVERMKSITGEDNVSIGILYKEAWCGKLPTRLIIACNTLPAMIDASGALADRLILLKYDVTFLGREDKTLTDKLLIELSGILNWALDGLDDLYQQGRFTLPQGGSEVVEEFRELGSPMVLFVNDCLDEAPAAMIEKDALFVQYQQWCTRTGTKPQSRDWMFRDLLAAFPDIKYYRPKAVNGEKSRPTWIKGIGHIGSIPTAN